MMALLIAGAIWSFVGACVGAVTGVALLRVGGITGFVLCAVCAWLLDTHLRRLERRRGERVPRPPTGELFDRINFDWPRSAA